MSPSKKINGSQQISDEGIADLRKQQEAADQAAQSLSNQFSSGSNGDIMDKAADASADELTAQLAQRESQRSKNFDEAIDAHRRGMKDICNGCGKKIPRVRLDAVPYAIYCITCQGHVEKHGVGDASISLSFESNGSFEDGDDVPVDVAQFAHMEEVLADYK